MRLQSPPAFEQAGRSFHPRGPEHSIHAIASRAVADCNDNGARKALIRVHFQSTDESMDPALSRTAFALPGHGEEHSTILLSIITASLLVVGERQSMIFN
jgi:hypothetical protein